MALETGESKYIRNKYSNTQSDLIEITEDKLRIILNESYSIIKRTKDWIGAAGLFLSILITLLTSNFRDTLILKSEIWNAIFWLCLVISGIYLIYVIFNKFKNRISVDEIIDQIKNQTKA